MGVEPPNPLWYASEFILQALRKSICIFKKF